MNVRTGSAMAEVQNVFGSYPKPQSISYCSQCYADDEVRAFAAKPIDALSENDLFPIISDGCTCFGSWSEIAYYVPRLLEETNQTYGSFSFGLPKLFLVAARVKLNNMLAFPDGIETEMALGARTAIFNLGQALLEDHLENYTDDASWSLLGSLSFLAAFDSPIEPLLMRLEQNENLSTRASFWILIAGLAAKTETFDDFMISNWSLLPENQSVFDKLLNPANALEMLMAHIDEIVEQWPESEEELSQAFDRLPLIRNL